MGSKTLCRTSMALSVTATLALLAACQSMSEREKGTASDAGRAQNRRVEIFLAEQAA